ncbi:hypothetical protein [Devosia aurantiaca]|uniref:Uncharacterized protein n=1 Tax=Devosia aurantiaca TaxID=2714858 RepID=A0A6M1SGC5_9HYPH|nr:hypothetical protein [Devosia aurantiaca]NGP18889.1 hypothetical protein [Devosia aurantiaca]
MISQENSTGLAGEASAPSNVYSAMSVWDIYMALTTLVGVKQFFNLSCCAQASGETAAFEWAEAREAEVDAHITAMASNLAGRLGLSRDEEDVRDMAFARIDGFVHSGVVLPDGRIARMRTAAQLAVAK